jgi:hypothetical protein
VVEQFTHPDELARAVSTLDLVSMLVPVLMAGMYAIISAIMFYWAIVSGGAFLAELYQLRRRESGTDFLAAALVGSGGAWARMRQGQVADGWEGRHRWSSAGRAIELAATPWSLGAAFHAWWLARGVCGA